MRSELQDARSWRRDLRDAKQFLADRNKALNDAIKDGEVVCDSPEFEYFVRCLEILENVVEAALETVNRIIRRLKREGGDSHA